MTTRHAQPINRLIQELTKLPGVGDVKVDLTFDPVWDPHLMASEECKDALGIY